MHKVIRFIFCSIVICTNAGAAFASECGLLQHHEPGTITTCRLQHDITNIELTAAADLGSVIVQESWTLQPDVQDMIVFAAAGTVQFVDIRPGNTVENGVIPDSISIPYANWRAAFQSPGRLPNIASLNALLGDAGLRLDAPIVIIHAGADTFDTGRGAFVYWLLKSSGATQLALINGGFEAWKSQGLPVAAKPRIATPYLASFEFAETWYVATQDVRDIADGVAPGILVDARASDVFIQYQSDGTQLASTLPGASNVSVRDSHMLMEKTDNDAVALLLHLKGRNLNWQQEPVVNFSETGELAALNWFHASEIAGISNVKLYPESSKGWVMAGEALVAAITAD